MVWPTIKFVSSLRWGAAMPNMVSKYDYYLLSTENLYEILANFPCSN